jgi:hypothetical protein
VTCIVSQPPSSFILARRFWYVAQQIFVQGPKLFLWNRAGRPPKIHIMFPICVASASMFTAAGFSCLPKDHCSLSENRVTPNSDYHHFPYWSGNLEVYTIFNIPDIPIWGFPWMGNPPKWLVYKCLWMFVIFYNGKSQSKYGWFRGTSISGNLHVETAWGPGKAKPAAKDQLQILVRKLTGKSNMAGKSFFKTCEEWWFQLISCVLPTNNCDFMVISWLLDGKSPD